MVPAAGLGPRFSTRPPNWAANGQNRQGTLMHPPWRTAGDVDGDGYADLIVGAQGY